MLIADHLNLTGARRCVGPRFVDLTDLYSPRLRALAREIDPSLAEGVYAGLPGPHFETPAEIRMLRGLGADLVGMSTVLEAIAARAEGVEVFGLSLVTNLAAGHHRRAARPPGGARRRRRRGRPDGRAAARAGRPLVTPCGPALRDAAHALDRRRPRPRRPAPSCSGCSPRRMAGDPAAAADLADRMAGPLRFGTAGLRGPVRAGPTGMNLAVVRRATAGLAAWLAAPGRAGAGRRRARRPARLGRLRRRRRRRCWPGPGFAVQVLPAPLPTPVLAFAVRQLGAVAGVQITASHNPPPTTATRSTCATARRQLAPPVGRRDRGGDRGARPAACRVPIAATARRSSTSREAYLDRVGRLPRGTARALRVALTPLHGVGGETAVHALHRAGFTDVHVVAAQAAPDPDFPTVAFPNPEEPGATDPLLALAAEVGADLAIALDPDADRCALGVPDAGRRLADAHRRRDRRAARRPPAARPAAYTGPARRHDRRLVVDAAAGRRGARRAVRRDADRVQVDRPRRARAGVRLRGGAGLLRRPGRGARQGRHRRGRARLRPRGRR